MSDARNFDFIGTIQDAMLFKVPLDNAIVREYQNLPSSSVGLMPVDLRQLIDESTKPKGGGGVVKEKPRLLCQKLSKLKRRQGSLLRNRYLHLRFSKKSQMRGL